MTDNGVDNAIIFYHVAEYCDYCAKLIIKRKKRQVRLCIWDTTKNDYDVITYNCWSKKRAWKRYRLEVGIAILGGWNVLNKYPEKVTWEN